MIYLPLRSVECVFAFVFFFLPNLSFFVVVRNSSTTGITENQRYGVIWPEAYIIYFFYLNLRKVIKIANDYSFICYYI